MIQSVYSDEQLLAIAKESYENILRFCQSLEEEGYWREPESYLHRSVYEVFDMYLEAVLLNLCVYCGKHGPAQRGFLVGLTGGKGLSCPAEGDLPEEVLVAANKMLRTPPVILQLCGVRDSKERSFFSSYFVDSVLNILLSCSLLEQKQSKYADKFIAEYYEKISSFINEDQKHKVVNGRYVFLKLSTERFYIEKAPVENLRKFWEEEEERIRRKNEEQLRLQALKEEEDRKKKLQIEEQSEPENECKEEEQKLVIQDNTAETINETATGNDIAETINETVTENDIDETVNETVTEKEKVRNVFDYTDEELLELQQKGKLKISTPRMDQMKKEQEAALQRLQDERVEQIREEINRINHAKKLQQLLDELKGLIGLEEVKKEIQSLINLIKVKKMRESYQMPSMDVSYHMVFMGNPGTGKTTVARLVAQIYKELGILSKGHLVEVDRAGLVAGYVGQTAIKVKEVVEKALGGVLFIDEAYALSNKSDANDFGGEAIDTLVKMMEDHRDDLVIIVAGYKEEMDSFLKANTGLISRFNKFINFEDYSNGELLDILQQFVKKAGLFMEEAAVEEISSELEQLTQEQRFLFGNGRGMRNTFESILGKQADRIVQLDMPTEEQLMRIIREDVMGIIA